MIPTKLTPAKVSPMRRLSPKINCVFVGGGVGVELGSGVLLGIEVRVGSSSVGWGVYGAIVAVGSRVAVAMVPRLINRNWVI